MLTILQSKGHLIKKMTFSGGGMTADQASDVCEYINWYTSLRLVDLMLGDEKIDHLICNAKHPFIQVKQLVIVGSEFSCELQLNRIFPNMAFLTFVTTNEKLIPSLARNYQQMETLRFPQIHKFVVYHMGSNAYHRHINHAERKLTQVDNTAFGL